MRKKISKNKAKTKEKTAISMSEVITRYLDSIENIEICAETYLPIAVETEKK